MWVHNTYDVDRYFQMTFHLLDDYKIEYFETKNKIMLPSASALFESALFKDSLYFQYLVFEYLGRYIF